jgi:nucleoside phosphorylase
MDEFFESRSTLYAHDRARYPMYFGKKVLIPNTVGIIPKSTSATLTLARELGAWGLDETANGDRERDAKRVVVESLRQREDRAVTAALFSAAAKTSAKPESAIGLIRRQISVEYTRHFMTALNSDICTGVCGIEFFDSCGILFPTFDIPILIEISKVVGLWRTMEADWAEVGNFWEEICYSNYYERISEFQSRIDLLVTSLSLMFDEDKSNNIVSFRSWVIQILRKARGDFGYGDIRIDTNMFSIATSRLLNLIAYLSNNVDFARSKEVAMSKLMAELKYNYLIVVATETERACVIDKVRELGNTITPYRGGGRAYFDLGFIYGQRVALVQVAMGAATVGGSISTTLLMLPYLKPQFLVMVGIAFGVDETKQTLGTVLISRKILGYEQQRIGTTEDGNERRIVQRGSITDASPELVSLLEAATAVWSEAPVQTGLMLSGEKLVDNIDYREDLKSIANGEAIGGEMEGVGFVVATAEKPTPWVIVKAICDWADGNKSQQKKERQLIAAKNAVSLVFRALQIVPDREVS